MMKNAAKKITRKTATSTTEKSIKKNKEESTKKTAKQAANKTTRKTAQNTPDLMKEWVAVGPGRADWIELAREAYRFVSRLE